MVMVVVIASWSVVGSLRLKTEKKIGLPINLRSGCAISVETGKAANTMTEDEWEKFYYDLSERLNRDYPGLYKILFSRNRNGKGKNAN